jgi:hypothetical protein
MKQRQTGNTFDQLRGLVIGGHGIDLPPAFFQQLQTVKSGSLNTETLFEDIEHARGIVQPLLGAAGGGLKIRVRRSRCCIKCDRPGGSGERRIPAAVAACEIVSFSIGRVPSWKTTAVVGGRPLNYKFLS